MKTPIIHIERASEELIKALIASGIGNNRKRH